MIILFVICIFIIYIYLQSSQHKIRTLTVKADIAKDLKLLQVSDYHSNESVNIDSMIKSLNIHDFDAIVLTGDMISRNTTDFSTSLKLVKQLKTLCDDIYFVSGNHEAENVNTSSFLEELEALDVKILNLDTVQLTDDISLMGVSTQVSPNEIQSLVDDNHSKLKILLSHIPTRATELVSKEKLLILSGHTHGGQVRLPLIGQIITPEQPLFGGLDKGLTHLRENVDIYIDSGLGNSKFPIRTFNRVQVSIIDIVAK